MKTDLFLNSTAANILNCSRRYQLTCLWGYGQGGNTNTSFGTKFHQLAEELGKTGQINLLTLAQEQDVKLVLAASTLQNNYQSLFGGCHPIVDNNNIPAIEYKFIVPYIETNDYRIIITGTIDRIDIEENGLIRILDYKTARSIKPSEVLAEYMNHYQTRFYGWALTQLLYKDFPPSIQDKLLKLHVTSRYLGVFISFPTPKLQMSPSINLTQDTIDHTNRLITLLATKMISIASLGKEIAPPEGMLYHACGYCPFKNICSINNDSKLHKYLETNEAHPYDPTSWR